LQLVNGKTQIRLKAMGGSQEAEPKIFLDSQTALYDPEISPDEKWISYASIETGRSEVYVQAFPGPGERLRISAAGGMNSTWARNGRELFYLEGAGKGAMGGKMMAMDIQSGDHLKVGTPHELFRLPADASVMTIQVRSYDVYADGQHFLIPLRRRTAEPPVSRLYLLLNWIEDLKQRTVVAKP
jgi:hypothetical protein